MDVGTLIDAIVRQTTVMIAQLATAGGSRAQLAHTANQVFLDLVAALREQGLGSKVIADMFGMALRTYHQRVQRLGESRTERGRTLWEAVFEYLQHNGPISRSEILRRFSYDDEVVLRSLLKDLVDSGLVYRTGRGDYVRYHVAPGTALTADSPEQSLADLVCLTVHRLSPATLADIAGTLSIDPIRVRLLVDQLLEVGRLRRLPPTGDSEERFTSRGCVIPLGEQQGWEVAVFDHYQAMVSAVCTKLRLGRQRAQASDLVGGSTFSYTVWKGHPHFAEATQFLTQFRQQGAALREKIAAYNLSHEAKEPSFGLGTPAAANDRSGSHPDKIKVLVYAGQTLLSSDGDVSATGNLEREDDDEEEAYGQTVTT